MKRLFLLLILLPALAWAGNYGSSIEGKDANVSFVHTSAIDSAHFVFAYPDTSNWYDSVFTYPVAWGSSKIMNGAGLDLDSIGVHVVKVRYYSGGSVVGHTAGVWLHKNIEVDADTLAKIRDYTHAVQESINAHAPHGDDWASVGAGGVDLSDEVDSLLVALYDRTNDSNFIRLMAHVILNYDSAQFSDEYWTTIDSRLTNRSAIGDTNTNPFQSNVDVVARVTYVDSAETVITESAGGAGSDTTAIKAMHDNRGTSIFNPASDVVERVTFVDSTDTILKSVGATATVDTESVARSVWDDDIVPRVNRTVTASCAGTGPDTFDIYVFNGDTTAQEGVDICIYNEAKTAKALPSILTDVNGKAQVFLDAGIYPLYLQRLGVIYSQWDTITVSNNGIDSLWVISYDPGSAPAGNLTRIKGFNRDFGFNKGERLTITFSLPYKNVIDTSQNVFIDRKEIVVFSDTGYFEADLIPGIKLLSQVSGAVKDSLKYNVKISAPDRPVFEWNRFDVPDTTGTVWLIDLIR